MKIRLLIHRQQLNYKQIITINKYNIMNTKYYPLLLAISVFLLLLNIYQYRELDRQITFNALNNVKDEPLEDQPVIIWNDDCEGIPADGSEVVIEQTINDTIYIGAIDNK